MSAYGNRVAFPMMPSHTDPAKVDPRFQGLTVRDYFAAMALQGILANSFAGGSFKPLSEASKEELAEMAVEDADALIAALEHFKASDK